MSILGRIWQNIRPRSLLRYVGRDLEGNRFYEHPSSSNDPRRTKRTVQYGDPEAVWHYIGGGRRLPVQWSAWLSHTRANPPTLQELEVDMARQQRMQMKVAMIQARDLEDQKQMLRLAQSPPSNTLPPPTPSTAGSNSSAGSLPAPAPELKQALPKMATTEDSYKPESWSPRSRGRAGGS
ncbi:hypothetical protein BD779DRAFT_1520596 [Infundibulicybe gibba]|nr:hypothetical protein BD779DRAFT_1520596 [Infundibulicybe gibba]